MALLVDVGRAPATPSRRAQRRQPRRPSAARQQRRRARGGRRCSGGKVAAALVGGGWAWGIFPIVAVFILIRRGIGWGIFPTQIIADRLVMHPEHVADAALRHALLGEPGVAITVEAGEPVINRSVFQACIARLILRLTSPVAAMLAEHDRAVEGRSCRELADFRKNVARPRIDVGRA